MRLAPDGHNTTMVLRPLGMFPYVFHRLAAALLLQLGAKHRRFRVKDGHGRSTGFLFGARPPVPGGLQRVPLVRSRLVPNTDLYPKGTPMTTFKTFVTTVLAAALCFVLVPSSISSASGGGGGGGTVAGKCGIITSISASTVHLSATGSGYTASPLQIRGEVFNCSIYLQSYWIDFDEPTNINTTCKASFSLFNALLLSSGSTQGFTTSTNIAPSGLTSTAGCIGTHTVRAVLRSRTDGTVLSTVFVSYPVA